MPKTSPEIGGMGHSVKRKEDARFIRGKGNYVDDVRLPGMIWLDIVRSPYAHAKIIKIDTSKALAIPGVLAVITGQDLAKYNLHWMPTLMSDTQMVLPVEKVMYQAQEVAAVLATDRYIAADGVEAVQVDYEPLPVVVDPFKALEPGAPVLRTDKKDKKDNHIWHWEVGDKSCNRQNFQGSRSDGQAGYLLAAYPCLLHRDLRLRRGLRQGERKADRVDDDPGAARHPHGLCLGGGTRGTFRREDPDHLAGHRRRLRRQGAGLPRLCDRRCGFGFDRQAGEVDRGPDGKSSGGFLCPRLSHQR